MHQCSWTVPTCCPRWVWTLIPSFSNDTALPRLLPTHKSHQVTKAYVASLTISPACILISAPSPGVYYFYRAMHLSAYARSWNCMSHVRLSICLSFRLSVTLVICDHIGWKSRKLIARTISPTPSLLAAERRSNYSQGNMEKFGETWGGVGKKWRAGEQKRQYLWNA